MATTFVSGRWQAPGKGLDAAAYCKVCLIDTNPPGKTKTKIQCHLPIRQRPGGPVYKQALRSAAAALMGARKPMVGVSASQKKAAARKLVRLMRQAKMEPGASILRMAGMK